MDVYVVERGTKYEGGSVQSLHSSYDSAFAVAKSLMDAASKEWDEYRAQKIADGEEVSEWDKYLGVYEYSDPYLDEGEEQISWVWVETADYVSIRKMPVLE